MHQLINNILYKKDYLKKKYIYIYALIMDRKTCLIINFELIRTKISSLF